MGLYHVYDGALTATAALLSTASAAQTHRPILLSVFLLVTATVGVVAFVWVRCRR